MLTGKQLQILAVLAENPAKELYLSEIGRIIEKSPGVFQKSINALEREGWVSSRKSGNQRLFRVNDKHPLFSEMKLLLRKTSGAQAVLKNIVSHIDGIKTALIYGSYAKDSMRADSDIDLLVVAASPADEDILVEALAKAERSLAREINYKFYNTSDLKRRLEKKDPFLKQVLSGKILIIKGKI